MEGDDLTKFRHIDEWRKLEGRTTTASTLNGSIGHHTGQYFDNIDGNLISNQELDTLWRIVRNRTEWKNEDITVGDKELFGN
jgi:hypothetical protein